MPEIEAAQLVPLGHRAVIVAPHPDDEILGCGGLLYLLNELGRRLALVAVTDGDGSHPQSSLWPASRLRNTRPLETREALRRLHLERATVTRLAIPDGQVSDQEEALQRRLLEVLTPQDIVFVTWRLDGHPDHEATGRAAVEACRLRGIRCIEVPIWTWHWATPGDPRVPWERARRLNLEQDVLAVKKQAVNAFGSQLSEDPSTGQGPILPPAVVARLTRAWEVYLT
ncbi:acetylglucosaminylphosphatidylinositol deacetylase [Pseudomonas oryzihabitans]|nr:acetylglucosaminylphosphatidylinositol deacetylase [Pseudomonas psychrotolerans]KTT37755.1 acetylglucosaminylphosphatidylinositol deacetylase [Pseudomonas psychrotolerans]KTT76418.1 acetylglucosaminylphosphatidylinositol deacetylase [Pseudomonas psychrotolerans]